MLDVDINESLDPVKWILKYGSQGRNLEPYGQVVKVGEGWVDLKSLLLMIAGLSNE